MTMNINNEEKMILLNSKQPLDACLEYFAKNVLEYSGDVQGLFMIMVEMARNAEVDMNYIRPMLWKVVLGIFPINNGDLDDKEKKVTIETWVNITNAHRKAYQLKVKGKKKKKLTSGNPLDNNISQDSDWAIYHHDIELRKLIKIEVDKIFPNINLLCQEYIRNIIASIIFIWSKENSKKVYKEGLYELLGCLIYSIYPYYFNNEIPLTGENIANPTKSIKELYLFFHNEKHFEADIYWMFNQMMKEGVETIYLNDKGQEKKDKAKDAINFIYDEWIYKRWLRVFNDIIQIYDDDVYQYFKKKDFNCTSGLEKWIQAFFTKDFPLNETAIIWDVIFAQERLDIMNKVAIKLNFVDFIAATMIEYIRKFLFGTFEECHTKMINFPQLKSPSAFIKHSMKIYNKVTQHHSHNPIISSTTSNSKSINNQLSSIATTSSISSQEKTPFQSEFNNQSNYSHLQYKLSLDKLEEIKAKYAQFYDKNDIADFEFILNHFKENIKD